MATKTTATTTTKSTKDRLHQLVDQLDDARAEAMLVLLSPPNGAENGQHNAVSSGAVSERERPLANVKPITADDPLWELIGAFTSAPGEPTDVAENHDKYLAEAYADLHEE